MKRSLSSLASQLGRVALGALAALAMASTACTKGQLVDIAMSGTPRAASHHGMQVGDRLILGGDMHCHVLPPDAPYHVSRELPETLALAKDEALDFVVLTPHVPARFFMDEEMRGWVMGTQQLLRARLERLRPELVVIPGFEYTDRRYGHVGASFADATEVLGGLSAADAQANPERFFEMWLARGGILTVNHPVNRPLPNSPFRELGADMSWRAYRGVPVPAEVDWITTHAQAIETFNSSVTELRDLFIVGEEDRSLREASHIADRIARTQHRRVAAVGGSDSHGNWLRATTYVIAKDRTLESIRKGIASGRTCVRGPEACTLEVRLRGGAWLNVGDAITTHEGTPTETTTVFEGRATGDDVTFVVNGSIVASATSGEVVSFPVPTERCAIVRAIVGRSWSSGVYVNCF
jgi:hypothetical protein